MPATCQQCHVTGRGPQCVLFTSLGLSKFLLIHGYDTRAPSSWVDTQTHFKAGGRLQLFSWQQSKSSWVAACDSSVHAQSALCSLSTKSSCVFITHSVHIVFFHKFPSQGYCEFWPLFHLGPSEYTDIILVHLLWPAYDRGRPHSFYFLSFFLIDTLKNWGCVSATSCRRDLILLQCLQSISFDTSSFDRDICFWHNQANPPCFYEVKR